MNPSSESDPALSKEQKEAVLNEVQAMVEHLQPIRQKQPLPTDDQEPAESAQT
jgi:hypothetical protein